MNIKKLLALLDVAIAILGHPIDADAHNGAFTIEDDSLYQSKLCYKDLSLIDEENLEVDPSLIKCVDIFIPGFKLPELSNGDPDPIFNVDISFVKKGEDNSTEKIFSEEFSFRSEDLIQVEGASIDGGLLIEDGSLEVALAPQSYFNQSEDLSDLVTAQMDKNTRNTLMAAGVVGTALMAATTNTWSIVGAAACASTGPVCVGVMTACVAGTAIGFTAAALGGAAYFIDEDPPANAQFINAVDFSNSSALLNNLGINNLSPLGFVKIQSAGEDLGIKNSVSAFVENENQTALYWESIYGYHVATTPGVVNIDQFAAKVFDSKIGIPSNYDDVLSGNEFNIDWISFNYEKSDAEAAREIISDPVDPKELSFADADSSNLIENPSYRFCGYAPKKGLAHGDAQEGDDYAISGEFYLNTWGPVGDHCSADLDPFHEGA